MCHDGMRSIVLYCCHQAQTYDRHVDDHTLEPPPFAAAQLYYVYVRYLGDRAFVLRRFNTHVYVRAIYVIVTIVVGHIPACQVDCQASTNVLQRALKICSFSAFMETM